ncbi:hypothetical protein [Photobacterium phosphoreum]|uniref:hypothetical protein n=1 Tax=Photobacterium phosphoreum TaxID=659 RepID=UPI000D1752A0|nr:hypothetical protein [Photobacterium phosphoreum]PTB32806.1 hypothetical protein DAT36_09630 [Photobacterium phosphoreum]
MKFIVSNIGDRNHESIFSVITKGAFFDLTPIQHGWDDYLNITIASLVYVIDKKRNIQKIYRVTGIVDGVMLKDNDIFSITGGNTRVLFGEVVDELDQHYSDFIQANNILSPKLNPKTGKMYPGFNCVSFK